MGADGRPSLYDLTIPENWNKRLIIFCHGYMGYKDWGAWNLMGNFFVKHGFGFLKYNVSHNGGTVENGIDFPDLEAFSMNSYSKELMDMEAIIALSKAQTEQLESIYLLGHSRAGGTVLLQSQNPLVAKIAALAPIADISKRFPSGEELETWRISGTRFTTNGRTKQQMPHDFSQYTDFVDNEKRLNIEFYTLNSEIPICVIHGEKDTSVKIEEGETIAHWAGVELIRIPNEEHTFGASQPWTKDTMPVGLQLVCDHLLGFFVN